MKLFSKLYSDFWINYDNAEVINLGIDAQLMALYLQGNSHHNILGVYYLPILYIASDLKLPVKKIQTALKKLCDISYCKYDEKTQYIWVCGTALEQIGENIDIKDNRIKAIQTVWQSLPAKLSFLSDIYHKYHNIFYLEPRFSDFSESSMCSSIFEEGSKPLQSSQETANIYNFYPLNAFATSLNGTNATADSLLDSIDCSDTLISSQEQPEKSSDSTDDINKVMVLAPSLSSNSNSSLTQPLNLASTSATVSYLVPTLTSVATPISLKNLLVPSEDHSKGILTPFEAPSKALQSPFEAPPEPLRSNIEYRIKNIEVRSKIEEKEERKTKKTKKKDISLNRVLTPSIVAQARPPIDFDLEKPSEFNSLSLNLKSSKTLGYPSKTTDAIETTETIGTPGTIETAKTKEKKEKAVETLKVEPNAVAKNTTVEEIKVAYSADSAFLNSSASFVIPATSVVPTVPITPKAVTYSEDVAVVFNHWKSTMGHLRSKLDCKRSSLIRKALHVGYSVEQLCDAVTGCSLTPHNIGQNDRGQRYDGLHVILRDADQIDRFIYNFHHPPRPVTAAHQRLQANILEVNGWLKEKFNESMNKTNVANDTSNINSRDSSRSDYV